MKKGDHIQLELRQAAVYRNHGLFAEAAACCRQALAHLDSATDSPVKDKLEKQIAERMAAIEADAARVDAMEKSSQLAVSQQQVIENGMGGPQGGKGEEASFQIAATLMGFGQFNKALSAFDNLLENPEFRVAAAKNILRCQIAVGSADLAARQYHQWLEGDSFPNDDLEKLRIFLEATLHRKGSEEELARPSSALPAEDVELEEGMLFDVMAVVLPDLSGKTEGDPPVFDVTSQSGMFISLIISESEKSVVMHLKPGDRIQGVSFYTPDALFSDDCIVSSRLRIDEGRRKGDFSVTLRLLDA